MIEKKLSQLQKFKTITLSTEEASLLRAHVARTISLSPKSVAVPVYQRAVHHGLRIMLSTFIFMIFVAGSVSVVANNALPGDPLYPFKLKVNEEINLALLNTSEKKATYQTNRIDARLNEIKTLAETKTLTKAKQVTVQNALDDHITALSKELDNATPTAALKVTNDLELNLKAQKESLAQSIPQNTTDSDKNEVLQVYDAALSKVSAQEITIISKEIDAIAAAVADTKISSTEPSTPPDETKIDPGNNPPTTSPKTTPDAP